MPTNISADPEFSTPQSTIPVVSGATDQWYSCCSSFASMRRRPGSFQLAKNAPSVKDGALGKVSFMGRGNAIGARDCDDSGLPRKEGCYPGMTAAKFSARNAIGGPVETCGPPSRRKRHKERRRFHRAVTPARHWARRSTWRVFRYTLVALGTAMFVPPASFSPPLDHLAEERSFCSRILPGIGSSLGARAIWLTKSN